jgi:F0F1-type ATP synthase assembly protein I
MVLVLFSRRPEMFLHPEFWAEDGQIFFVPADIEGVHALVTPYRGYHLFLLRLIAAEAAGLDARWVPAAYFAANLATILFIAVALFSPRIDLPYPAGCALAIAFLPHSGEVIGNLTNLQWLSALGLVWLLIAREPFNTRQLITDLLLAGVTGLTGVFSVLLMPLFVWRAWRRKTRASALLASILVITAAVQFWEFVHSARILPASLGPTMEPIAWFVGFRLPASLFLPVSWAETLPRWALDGLGLIAVAVLIAAVAWRGEHRERRLLLVASIVLVVSATIFQARQLKAFQLLRDGDRYFFLPKLLAAWLLISGLSARGFVRWATAAGCGLALIAAFANWHYVRLADHHWPEYARRIEAGERVQDIPINPLGMTFDHPGRN